MVDLSGRTARKEAQISGFHTKENLLKEIELSLLGIPIQEQNDFEQAINLEDEKKVAMHLSENANLELPNSKRFKTIALSNNIRFLNIASILLQHRRKRDDDRQLEPSSLRCLGGNPNSIQLCIEHGAIIDTRTKEGHTALHKACQSGNIETVKLLLENGANVDDSGWRPLHKAATNGHEIVLKTLLEHGAKILFTDQGRPICASLCSPWWTSSTR